MKRSPIARHLRRRSSASAPPRNIASPLLPGITIAMPRPEGDGTKGFTPLGASFSSRASASPSAAPTAMPMRASLPSAPKPLTKISDTPAHTRQPGAGHSSLPSAAGSGISKLNAGTISAAPATTPKSCA